MLAPLSPCNVSVLFDLSALLGSIKIQHLQQINQLPAKLNEATKTPVTSLKESEASAAEMGETVDTATVGWVLHQAKFFRTVAKFLIVKVS